MSHGFTTRPLGCALALSLVFTACQPVDIDPAVTEAPLPRVDDPVDSTLVATGETLFRRSCVACHDWVRTVVGPPLEGVAQRRSPEWIRAMVLAPDSMLRADAEAQALLETYTVPMPDLQLDEARFRAIWEFMRSR